MWWSLWQKYPNSSDDKFGKSYAKAVSFDTAFLFFHVTNTNVLSHKVNARKCTISHR